MVKKFIVFAATALLLSVCGDVPGSDPAHGTFKIDSINSAEENGTDIDVFADRCGSGDINPLVKAQATMVLRSESANPDATQIPPDVRVQAYRIDYEPLDGGPNLASHDYPIYDSAYVPGDGTLEFNVEMVPLKTKIELAEYMSANTTPAEPFLIFLYRTHYTVFAQNTYGVDLEAEGDITLTMTDFDGCN